MNSTLPGLVVILLTLILYALCLLLKNWILFTPTFLKTTRVQKLRAQLTRSYEESTPIHLDLYTADDNQLVSPAVLSGLMTAENLSNQLAAADEGLLVTDNAGPLHAFSTDAVKNGLRAADLDQELQDRSPSFAGFDGLSHQASMLGQLDKSTFGLHLNVGSAGAELALQDLMFSNDELILTAGDNLLGQATGLATADEVFVGEQLYELPTATASGAVENDISLIVMDVLRFGVLIAIAAGIALVLLV